MDPGKGISRTFQLRIIHDIAHADQVPVGVIVVFPAAFLLIDPGIVEVIRISGNARGAGFSFGSANYYRALAVELDMKFGLLRYDSSVVARMRYSTENSRISRRISTEKRQYHLDILIDNDVAVFFLDNREALSVRIYRMPGMPWGVYVSDGEACFDHLTMRLLKE